MQIYGQYVHISKYLQVILSTFLLTFMDSVDTYMGQVSRIERFMEIFEIKNARQLALSIDMDTSQMAKVMRGELGLPYKQALKIVDKYKDTQIEWLLNGTGSPPIRKIIPHGTHTSKKAPRQELHPVPFEDFMEVEYVSLTAQAGYGKGWADADTEKQTILVPREFEKGKYIVTDVNGDSMDDGTNQAICNGDKILLKELDANFYTKSKIYFTKFIFAFALKDDGIIIKQITAHDVEKGVFTCHSWNSYYKDFKITLEEISAVFYVKKIIERQINFKLKNTPL